MENESCERVLEAREVVENAPVGSASPSVYVFLKPGKINEGSGNQAVILMTKEGDRTHVLPSITHTQTHEEPSFDVSNIEATLENDSVWSRFHSYGTEMILTKPGRRMFPCCRFSLKGLEPDCKYLLVMDVVPVDGSRYRWNGKMWEASGSGEPHVLRRVCLHPDSPSLGRRWMEGPVSFYKMKLTNNVMDQDGHVVLHSMHRYLPRLHVVPVRSGSEELVPLDSPNVRMFTFPKTEFYAVTCYQNPQITQLKIDYNPFAKAFRDVSQGARFLKSKLKFSFLGNKDVLSSPLTVTQDALPSLNSDLSEKCSHPELGTLVEDQEVVPEVKRVVPYDRQELSFCADVPHELTRSGMMDSSQCDSDSLKQFSTGLRAPTVAVSKNDGTLDIENGDVTMSGKHCPPDSCSDIAVRPNAELLEFPAAVQLQSHEKFVSPVKRKPGAALPELSPPFAENTLNTQRYKMRPPKAMRKARKPKSKCWSKTKYFKGSGVKSAINPTDGAVEPHLDDVEGILFVSFTTKEALSVDVGRVAGCKEASHPPPVHIQGYSEKSWPAETNKDPMTIEEKISNSERALLQDLKQQMHRQVIHPDLQEVGLKLNPLDPAVSIDLQYLGVYGGLGKVNGGSLVPPPGGAVPFVSRTGKTNDPTKIKGWKDKFSPETPLSTPEEGTGPKNHSAFCSELLDQYLESEAQKISDRAAAFSKISLSPVTYCMPSKSSSYVRTLDSVLKSRYIVPPNTSNTNIPHKSLDKSVVSSRNHLSFSPMRPKQVSPVPAKKMKLNISARPLHVHHSTKPVTKTQSILKPSHKSALTNQSHTPEGRRDCSLRAQGSYSPGARGTALISKAQQKLLAIEKETVWEGKARTDITTERAQIALSVLLTAQSTVKVHHFSSNPSKSAPCGQDFCRLGCVCTSLHRERRGPTHCRRTQCMFGCTCFKHKVLLIRPPPEDSPEVMQRKGRRKQLMGFPIADPDREPRPEPPVQISTLWNRKTGETDPEPLYAPKTQPTLPSPQCKVHMHNKSQPKPEMQEEEKDPVYLYFESMMTCARVREYNSTPPPQVHIFPGVDSVTLGGKQKDDHSECPVSKPGTLPYTGESPEEDTVLQGKPSESEATKLLEIYSECNWEPHRNLVLSALCRRMKKDLLAPPFRLGSYHVRLISTTHRKKERSYTITYKVCVSHSDKMEDKRKGWEKKKRDSVGILPFLSHVMPTGVLKAEKKVPGVPPQGLIMVNGKSYNQAKLLLGQMGALHPANRLAAFVTGKLQALPREIPKVAPVPKEPEVPIMQTSESPTVVAKPTSTNSEEEEKELDAPAITTPTSTTDISDSNLDTITPTLQSSEPVPASKSTGEKVVLQSIPGIIGSNLYCHPSGQLIQLVPVNQLYAALSQPKAPEPKPDLENKGNTLTSATTALNPKARLTPAAPTPKALRKAFSKPLPLLAPKMPSLSGKSGINFASGTPAIKLPSSFLNKTGTFSFRICPPTGEGKLAVHNQSVKTLNLTAGFTPTMALPGGFTLIQLPKSPIDVNTTVSSDNPDATPYTSLQNEALKCRMPPEKEQSSKRCDPSIESKEQNTESHVPTPNQENRYNDQTKSKMVSSGNSDQTLNAGSKLVSNASYLMTKRKNPVVRLQNLFAKPLDSITSLPQIVIKKLSKEKEEVPQETLTKRDADSKTWNTAERLNNTEVAEPSDDHDWIPRTAEQVLREGDDWLPEGADSGEDDDDWPPKGAERVLWDEEDASDEEDKDQSEDNDENSKDPLRAGSPHSPAVTQLSKSHVDLETIENCEDSNVTHSTSPQKEPALNAKLTSEVELNSGIGVERKSCTAESPMSVSDPEAGCDGQTCFQSSDTQTLKPYSKSHSDASLDHISESSGEAVHNDQTQSELASSPVVRLQNLFSNPQSSKCAPLQVGRVQGVSGEKENIQEEITKSDPENKMGIAGKRFDGSGWARRSAVRVLKEVSGEPRKSNEREAYEDKNNSDDEVEMEQQSNDSVSHSDYEEVRRRDGTFSEDDEIVDIETFEERTARIAMNKLKDEAMNREARLKDAERNALLRERLKKRKGQIQKPAVEELCEPRLYHNEKERQRRRELRMSFTQLQQALSLETELKLSKLDILSQALLMIRALVSRSRYLKERRKVLCKQQAIYIEKISKMSGKSERMIRAKLMDICEKQKKIEKLSSKVSQINPRRLDTKGNPLPPRLGLWKSKGYIRKRYPKPPSGQSPGSSSSVPEVNNLTKIMPSSPPAESSGNSDLPASLIPGVNMVLKLLGQNPQSLPSLPETEPEPPAIQISDSIQPPPALFTPPSSSETAAPGSLSTGVNVVLKLIGQNSCADPISPSTKTPPAVLYLSGEEICSLPKIILKPLSKTDIAAVVNNKEETAASQLTKSQRDSQTPTDSVGDTAKPLSLAPSLDAQDKVEKSSAIQNNVDIKEVSTEIDNAGVSEDSNKENPSAAILKSTSRRRSPRGKGSKPVQSDPDGTDIRQLRSRSTASKVMPTRNGLVKKRQRVI